MKREQEEKKKEELIKKREEELRLKEEREKREQEKAEVALYKLQKQEEKQIINAINKIEEKEKHIPPSPELLLYRHKLNLEKVNKRKDLINRKQRAESARKARMDDLMNRPSSVEAPRDKNRVLQPTAAYQGKRYSSDELDVIFFNFIYLFYRWLKLRELVMVLMRKSFLGCLLLKLHLEEVKDLHLILYR